MGLADLGKRLLIGRKLRSTQLGHTVLRKWVAFPVFASDALSSVAYAPDEIFLVLAFAGLSLYALSWKVGIAVGLVLLVVVASYRQNVRAYKSGGGDYEVATTNLGKPAGLAVGSALLVDYVLTVAVSISAAAQYAASAIEPLRGHQAVVAVVAVLVLMTLNLRGVRESGRFFAIPTYLFLFVILGMCTWGFLRYARGDLPLAESSELTIAPVDDFESGAGTLMVAFLVLRAFASGCAALTGVEAIANGVPAFRKPRGRNAATTLALLGVMAVGMGLAINVLGNLMQVRIAEDPATQLLHDGEPVGDDYHQSGLVGQLAAGIFDHFPPGFYLVAAVTGLILVLAANTAFNGFPVLGSILARDSYLPRQLHTRGDRLAFSNGIILLAVAASGLTLAYDARVTSLIQLYIVGVFVSFTLGQAGMVVHWTRRLATETDAAERRRMQRSRLVNAVGLTVTAVVLIVVVITKFTAGAWISVLAMGVLMLLMLGINRHYANVRRELAVDPTESLVKPSHVHAVVLVSRLHKPTLRALSFARVSRPDVLEAITVNVSTDETKRLVDDWDRHDIPIPLKVLASPYREVTRPVVEYVANIRRSSPRHLIAVYIPEYVVGHWWEQLLHNQSALWLKARLRLIPGVMVSSVPYQLVSSEVVERRGGGRGGE
ncbi:MAG TPA: APC family permease [Actinopolymorphaceae bacterium]